MANKRTPIGIPVNGVSLLVKDPDAGTNDLFYKYQRVPGIANFTMPDETGSSNETQLIDGNIAYANIAGVGTITGSIGALSGHATHQFLAKKKEAGGKVTIAIVQPATKLEGRSPANVTNTATSDIVNVTGATHLDIFKTHAKEGVLLAIGGTTDDLEDYAAYDATVAAGNDHAFRSILKVKEDGTKVQVAGKIATALSGTSNAYELRSPGIRYQGISCTVNGFGGGDFQAGSGISANVSFQPDVVVPAPSVEHRILSELNTAFDAALAELS